MDIIRFLIIVFISGVIAILFTLLTGLWPFGIVLFLALIGVGLYIQVYIVKKFGTTLFSKLFVKEKRYEIVEHLDESNVPNVEYPTKNEIDDLEKTSGKRFFDQGAGTRTQTHASKSDSTIESFMKIFDIDKKRASLLFNNGYTSMDDLKGATVEDLTSIEGMSPTVARKIVSKINSLENT
jgi:hypothetical protein